MDLSFALAHGSWWYKVDQEYIFFTLKTYQVTFVIDILWYDCKNWKWDRKDGTLKGQTDGWYSYVGILPYGSHLKITYLADNIIIFLFFTRRCVTFWQLRHWLISLFTYSTFLLFYCLPCLKINYLHFNCPLNLLK